MRKLAYRIYIAFITILVLAGAATADASSSPGDTSSQKFEWNFIVYLDNDQIGHHNFHLAKRDDSWLLTTEADFKVRFLVFTAYRYQHSNREVWQNNCLQEIESRTNANGTPFTVNGVKADSGFTIQTNRFRDDLGDCVKTFAYWNPAILNESMLLNSQTGELLPISVETAGEEMLKVKGQEIPAIRYHLVANGMELDIWYSTDQRWLALESVVKGGRKLRYELI